MPPARYNPMPPARGSQMQQPRCSSPDAAAQMQQPRCSRLDAAAQRQQPRCSQLCNQLSPTLPPTREAANGRAREEEEEGRRTRTGGRLTQDRNESDQSWKTSEHNQLWRSAEQTKFLNHFSLAFLFWNTVLNLTYLVRHICLISYFLPQHTKNLFSYYLTAILVSSNSHPYLNVNWICENKLDIK